MPKINCPSYESGVSFLVHVVRTAKPQYLDKIVTKSLSNLILDFSDHKEGGKLKWKLWDLSVVLLLLAYLSLYLDSVMIVLYVYAMG